MTGRQIKLNYISPRHFQVHPEGKFVVDVDKNIDINDVSIIVVVVLIMAVSEST